MSDSASFVTPLDSADNGLLGSTGLGFLLRFQHFLTAMAAGEKGKAAELLGALFASQDVPKSFLAILLMDSVPLLEGGSFPGRFYFADPTPPPPKMKKCFCQQVTPSS